MGNLIDYINWRGDLSFRQCKVNKIDCLLFSQIVMLDFSNIVSSSDQTISLKDAVDIYDKTIGKDKKLGLIVPDEIVNAFYLMAKCDRYKNILLSNFVREVNERSQFAAMTLTINNDLNIIAYQGTDDTIAGWIENLDMIWQEEVLAQEKAIKYLDYIISKHQKKFIVCGHSKGGNLALYATLKAKEDSFNKIYKTYNFDGPGIVNDLKNYNSDRLKKIMTYLPHGAIVGMLFTHPEKQKIVRSYRNSLYQHDAFSWEIVGKEFSYEKDLIAEVKEIDKNIKIIIDEMDFESRKLFVETINDLLSKTEAKTLIDLSIRKKSFLSNYFKLDKKTRGYFINPIKKLLRSKAIKSNLFKTFKESISIKNNKI